MRPTLGGNDAELGLKKRPKTNKLDKKYDPTLSNYQAYYTQICLRWMEDLLKGMTSYSANGKHDTATKCNQSTLSLPKSVGGNMRDPLGHVNTAPGGIQAVQDLRC